MFKFFLDLVSRFTSRKFLLALSSSAALGANDQWTALSAVVVGYLASEGGADFVTRMQTGRAKIANIEKVTRAIENGVDLGLDKGSVVPGVSPNIPIQ